MKKMLIIVDPQNDFIHGSLPVPGAAKAMDQLASYIDKHAVDYQACIITLDWHPWHHASFDEHGGLWPRHCVAYSEGAAIWPALLQAVSTSGIPLIKPLHKGMALNRDQYSIFQNAQARLTITSIIDKLDINHIDICGLAGDVCVLNTYLEAKELLAERDIDIEVLEEFSPSIDGGVKLTACLKG